jgi:GntR family transcriptional regulator
MNQIFSTIRLEKNIPIPLYYQLKKQLLSFIEQGFLKEGDKLPPEKELCEQLKVSRPTVRQAFGELSSEGYLHRIKGNGTFVSAPKVSVRFFNQLESFNNEMQKKGKTPKTQVLTLEKTSAYPKANELLGLSIDASLILLKRLRFANDVPLVYLDTYLPFDLYPQLLDIDFRTTSLYDALEHNYRTYVSRVVRDIEAVTARHKEAALLQCPQNQALILVRSLAYASGNPNPVEYSIARYRGDINTFSVEVFR